MEEEVIEPVRSSFSYKGLVVNLEITQHVIDDVLEAFENVLRASGYSFDGHLEIVNED